MARYRISGVPITDEAGKLVGILTNRDLRFETNYARPIYEVMTTQNLITAPVGTTHEQARQILAKHRIEKLPLVDEEGHLRGLDYHQGYSEGAEVSQFCKGRVRPSALRRGCRREPRRV